jgi:hypothetical protein
MLMPGDLYPRIGFRPFQQQRLYMGSGTAIIAQTQFPMRIRLIQHGTDAVVEMMNCGIVYRNDNRYNRFQRQGSHPLIRICPVMYSLIEIMLQS